MRASSDAMARTVDDEVVILHVPSGEYYSLNPVGAFIWERIEAGTDRDALADAVSSAFDVDREIAAADIDALLTDLAAAQLVEDV